MKKLATIIAVLAAASAFAWDTGGKDYVVIPAKSYTNGTQYSDAIDLTAYNGNGKLIIFVSGDEGAVSATNADKIVVQHSNIATSGFTTVSALTSSMPGLASTATVTKISVDLETLKNFVRFAATSVGNGGSNCAHEVAGLLVVPAKSD